MNDKYYARRYKVIRKLRQQGYTNRQIAEELEMAVGTVNHLVSHLVDPGLVARRRAGAPGGSAIARRNQKILALKQQGLTARAIAEPVAPVCPGRRPRSKSCGPRLIGQGYSMIYIDMVLI